MSGKSCGLTMAKASKADMDLAAGVASIMDALGRGYYPTLDDDGHDDAKETPTFFDEHDKDHLRALYDMLMKLEAKGSMYRVTFGFAVLMDNRVVDPDQDTLQFHPTLTSAVAARDPGEKRDEVIDTIEAVLARNSDLDRTITRRQAIDVLIAMGIMKEGE